MNAVLRAALYPRVSTEEQKKFGLSIHDQQNDLEEYAKAHNMKVVGVFQDAGFSARKKIEKRPAMLQLLEAVKRDEVDIILVTKLDRWFRNIGEYYKVQDILEAHNVSWKTIYEDYDTSTAAGRLKINIMLAVAQDEADRTSERIKRILDAKRERNEVCSGNLPRGYKIENKHAVIDETTEPFMKKFFSVFIETGSVKKARTSVPELRLSYGAASRILACTAYVGNWRGISVPPYLSHQEFDRIESLRKRTTRKPKTTTYLFSGLIMCGTCGNRMAGRPRELANGNFSHHYLCVKYERTPNCTNSVHISEAIIENYLLSHIDEEISVKLKAKPKEIDHQNTQAQIQSAKAKLSKLSDLYIDDMISKSDYAKRYKELTATLDELQKEIAPAKTAKDLSEMFAQGWQDIYFKLSRENKAAFWKLKIKEIRLYEDRRIEFDFL